MRRERGKVSLGTCRQRISVKSMNDSSSHRFFRLALAAQSVTGLRTLKRRIRLTSHYTGITHLRAVHARNRKLESSEGYAAAELLKNRSRSAAHISPITLVTIKKQFSRFSLKLARREWWNMNICADEKFVIDAYLMVPSQHPHKDSLCCGCERGVLLAGDVSIIHDVN